MREVSKRVKAERKVFADALVKAYPKLDVHRDIDVIFDNFDSQVPLDTMARRAQLFSLSGERPSRCSMTRRPGCPRRTSALPGTGCQFFILKRARTESVPPETSCDVAMQRRSEDLAEMMDTMWRGTRWTTCGRR